MRCPQSRGGIATTRHVLIRSGVAHLTDQYGVAGDDTQHVDPAICTGPEPRANTAKTYAVSVRRQVKVLHLQHVLTPSLESILTVASGIGSNPPVRIVPPYMRIAYRMVWGVKY